MTPTPPDEPTRWIPPVAPPPPGGPPLGEPPLGEPPQNPNRTIAAVAAGLAVVLVVLIGLLLLARHRSTTSSVSATTTIAPPSTAPSTTTPVRASTTTIATTTTQAPTTQAPTTTHAPPSGNRPATAAERQQILADVGDSHPGYQVTTLRIANSDNSWAALKYDGGPTQQPFEEVRHLSGGHWQAVSTGTAQVACDPSIPAQVQRDFADILGAC